MAKTHRAPEKAQSLEQGPTSASAPQSDTGVGVAMGQGEGVGPATPASETPILDAAAAAGDTAPAAAGPAPTIQFQNTWDAGGSTARTSVGPGEETAFYIDGEEHGSWTASDGRGSMADDGSFLWTAGEAAGGVTITVTKADGATASMTMTVVLPATVTGANPSATGQPADAAGGGMTLDLVIGPTNVSFSGVQWAEVGGDGSNPQGYFEGKTLPHHNPAPASSPGPGNVISDQATFAWSGGRPWSPGSFDWVIPNQWSLGGGGTHAITDVTQHMEILDATGAGRVSKAGVSS